MVVLFLVSVRWLRLIFTTMPCSSETVVVRISDSRSPSRVGCIVGHIDDGRRHIVLLGFFIDSVLTWSNVSRLIFNTRPGWSVCRDNPGRSWSHHGRGEVRFIVAVRCAFRHRPFNLTLMTCRGIWIGPKEAYPFGGLIMAAVRKFSLGWNVIFAVLEKLAILMAMTLPGMVMVRSRHGLVHTFMAAEVREPGRKPMSPQPRVACR